LLLLRQGYVYSRRIAERVRGTNPSADADEWHQMRDLNRELRADALRLRWLAADHADPEVRERVRSICQSIPVRGIGGVRLDIDANMGRGA